MKIERIIFLSAMVAALGVWSCNSDEDDYVPTDTEETGDDSEEDDGTGVDIGNQTFTKTITISWADGAVSVEGVADSVTIDAKTQDVLIKSQASEMEYVLKGSTTNGSIKIYSDEKFKLTLQDLALTSTTGAAINIQSAKKCFIDLLPRSSSKISDGANYTNALSTVASEDVRGAIFSEGPIIFSNKGAISVVGNYKHAIASDDYIAVTEEASVTVASAISDGLHVNDKIYVSGGTTKISNVGKDAVDINDGKAGGYFYMNGGSFTATAKTGATKAIKAAGNIIIDGGELTLQADGASVQQDSADDYKTAACLKSDSSVYINGGTIKLISNGEGGKGINTDGSVFLNGGEITINANGASTNSSSKAIKADADIIIAGANVTASSASSHTIDADGKFELKSGSFVGTITAEDAKCVKSTDNLTVSGGSLKITTNANKTKGLSSKATIEINGGTVEIETYDDALNADNEIHIGGEAFVYLNSANADAVDATGNIYIEGGNTVAIGSLDNEKRSFKTDGNFYITGGVTYAIGGAMCGVSLGTNVQPNITFTSKLANVAVKSSDDIIALTWNRETSGVVSNATGEYIVLVSTPKLNLNESYNIMENAQITSDSEFHGLSVTSIATGTTTKTAIAAASAKAYNY